MKEQDLIKAQDFRIGNFLNINVDGFIRNVRIIKIKKFSCKVEFLYNQDDHKEKAEFKVLYKNAYGIKIDEKWHELFCAEKVNDKRFVYSIRDVRFVFNHDLTKDVWWVEYFNNSIYLSMPIEIKFVHELQNFIYANTGNELIIRESWQN